MNTHQPPRTLPFALPPPQVLPGSSASTLKRLEGVQQELAQLDEQQAAVGRQAAVRQGLIIWGGLLSQAALWALLLRLTFYEL